MWQSLAQDTIKLHGLMSGLCKFTKLIKGYGINRNHCRLRSLPSRIAESWKTAGEKLSDACFGLLFLPSGPLVSPFTARLICALV